VLWYKNHLEACYCIEGEGTVEDMATGEVHKLAPGTLYCLDKHDRHHLKSEKGMRLICTFVPPIVGNERHDADGSFNPTA
jgi:L-ectoine synthase